MNGSGMAGESRAVWIAFALRRGSPALCTSPPASMSWLEVLGRNGATEVASQINGSTIILQNSFPTYAAVATTKADILAINSNVTLSL